MYGKTRKILFLCTAVLCAFLALSGCKPSPAFVETIYDDRAGDVDESADVSSLNNSEDNTDEDPALPPHALDEELGDPRGREREDPTAGKEEQEISAQEPEHNEASNPNDDLNPPEPTPEAPEETAPPPEETAPPPEETDVLTQIGTEPPQDGERIDLPEEAPETEPPAPEPTEEPAPTALSGMKRQVVDAAGRTVELPEAVEQVVAVGEAAVLVDMLGGAGRLSASSASLSAGLSGALLANECECLWSGDGRSPLSAEQFSRLLELKPQACLEISGQTTFTDEQLALLDDAGIAYVVLPSFHTDEGIRLAVTLIGEVLGPDGELNAQKRAEEYLAFHDRVLSLVASRVEPYLPDGIDYATGNSAMDASAAEGVTALFVSGWDSTAAWSLHDDAYETMSGMGLPFTVTGYLRSPVTAYLSLAGVANAAALKENNYSISQSKLRYVSPIHSPNKTLSVESGTGITYDPAYVFTSAGVSFLGESSFPAVIVASEEVRSGIESCPLWFDYGVTSSATGLTSGYGFTDKNGDIVISTVHGRYEILVMPSGIGNWAEGSGESVLTTAWAACAIRGVISESELHSMVAEFYESFYGIVLSDSQLRRILHEGAE